MRAAASGFEHVREAARGARRSGRSFRGQAPETSAAAAAAAAARARTFTHAAKPLLTLSEMVQLRNPLPRILLRFVHGTLSVNLMSLARFIHGVKPQPVCSKSWKILLSDLNRPTTLKITNTAKTDQTKGQARANTRPWSSFKSKLGRCPQTVRPLGQVKGAEKAQQTNCRGTHFGPMLAHSLQTYSGHVCCTSHYYNKHLYDVRGAATGLTSLSGSLSSKS